MLKAGVLKRGFTVVHELFLGASSYLCKRVCLSIWPSVCLLALWKTHRKRCFELAGRILFPTWACKMRVYFARNNEI